MTTTLQHLSCRNHILLTSSNGSSIEALLLIIWKTFVLFFVHTCGGELIMAFNHYITESSWNLTAAIRCAGVYSLHTLIHLLVQYVSFCLGKVLNDFTINHSVSLHSFKMERVICASYSVWPSLPTVVFSPLLCILQQQNCVGWWKEEVRWKPSPWLCRLTQKIAFSRGFQHGRCSLKCPSLLAALSASSWVAASLTGNNMTRLFRQDNSP